MRLKIYTLRDKKANYFTRLDLFENDLIALREYTLMLDKNSLELSNYDIISLGSVDNTALIPLIDSKTENVDMEAILSVVNKNLKEFNKYAKGL